MSQCRWSRILIGCLLALAASAPGVALATGRLTITTVDKDTGQQVACRMHLQSLSGRVLKPKKTVAYDDHFVFDGELKLDLSKGNYTFEIERGPEYPVMRGQFKMVDFADERKEIVLQRKVNLAQEGWYAADLHVHRSPKDIELLMMAEDLYLVPLITWWNKKTAGKLPSEPIVRFDTNRYYHALAGEDEREGGALLFFNLEQPLDITDARREFPPALEFVREARKDPNCWIDAEKPFWWDFPVWVAHKAVDSVGIVNNHLQHKQTLDNEAWGKPRDRERFEGPGGVSLWSQEIYFHALNCGLRLPPSAGSASGVLPNPVGYNRMYAFVGGEFTYDAWWEAFRAGRVMVTNGPLLRPVVEGKLPGHVFRGTKGGKLELDINLTLTTREPIRAIDIIKNGKVEHSMSLEELAKSDGLPKVRFDDSGWFLVRATAAEEENYHVGLTGPYYVEFGDAARVSRTSAQFFTDWIEERRGQIKLEKLEERELVESYLDTAATYWKRLADESNAP